MGKRKKWSLAARPHFAATIRGRLGSRRKGVEGLCVSSLLGVLRSHAWLIGEKELALLLAHSSSPPRRHHQRTHSLSLSLSSSADGGSEDYADPRSPSFDPHLTHIGQGKHVQTFTSTSLHLNVSAEGARLGFFLFIAEQFVTAGSKVPFTGLQSCIYILVRSGAACFELSAFTLTHFVLS